MTDKAANGANGEWQAVVAFHGHSCPRLVLGYRVAKTALRELGEPGRYVLVRCQGPPDGRCLRLKVHSPAAIAQIS
ncbi:MAG: hypothetical protein H5T97_12870 [Firmicutes bacterium]|nr:hypothetical protein [Bacillota bacterium]